MIFSKKQTCLLAVCTGKSMPLSDMGDEAFSSGMLGVGYAIEPAEGSFFAPVSGVVESIPKSGHAYTIQSDAGLDILIHIGVDTVSMGGEGFEPCVKEGQRVKAGELIARADLSRIRERGFSTVTATVVTEPEKIEQIEFRFESAVGGKDAVMCFRIK